MLSENNRLFLVRNPNEELFMQSVLIEANPAMSQAASKLAKANHSHFSGSELEKVYIEKASQGICFLLEQFKNGFDFVLYEEYVDITAYNDLTSERRTVSSLEPYYISRDVVEVLEGIRHVLGLSPRFDMLGEDLCESYRIDLDGIGQPAEVTSFGNAMLEVNLVPVEYASEFQRMITKTANTALTSNGSDFESNAISTMQLLIHKWHTVGGVASRAINFFNALLLYKGYNPSPHGVLDYAALTMLPEEYEMYVKAVIARFNDKSASSC